MIDITVVGLTPLRDWLFGVLAAGNTILINANVNTATGTINFRGEKPYAKNFTLNKPLPGEKA